MPAGFALGSATECSTSNPTLESISVSESGPKKLRCSDCLMIEKGPVIPNRRPTPAAKSATTKGTR